MNYSLKMSLMKMRVACLMICLGAILVSPVIACAQINSRLLPLTESVFYIDRDRDGYGVAAPNGPDADDSDPTVNTYNSAIAKYGSLEGLLDHLGYHPSRIFYNDTQPEILQPGDLVIYREGVYTGKYPLGSNDVHGTVDKPITMLAMPGKKLLYKLPVKGLAFGSRAI